MRRLRMVLITFAVMALQMILIAYAVVACAGSQPQPGPGCEHVIDVSRWDDPCPQDAGEQKDVK